MPACVCGAWKKGDSWLSRTLGRAKGSQMAPAWGTITAHRSVKSGFRGRGGRGLAEAGVESLAGGLVGSSGRGNPKRVWAEGECTLGR